MYQKFRDNIEQIKSSEITLHIILNFRDYIEQIKSSKTIIHVGLKFMDCLCHFPYNYLCGCIVFCIVFSLKLFINLLYEDQFNFTTRLGGAAGARTLPLAKGWVFESRASQGDLTGGTCVVASTYRPQGLLPGCRPCGGSLGYQKKKTVSV